MVIEEPASMLVSSEAVLTSAAGLVTGSSKMMASAIIYSTVYNTTNRVERVLAHYTVFCHSKMDPLTKM